MPITEYTLIHLPESPDDNVLLLELPHDTLRIWVEDKYIHTPTLRSLNGLAPKGARPVGYLLPDDRIITDGGGLRPNALNYVKTYFTGDMRHINDTADMPEKLRTSSGACIRCHNLHGKKHAASCAHAGKYVGDPVR
jgi:hypothetical protein